MTDDIEARPAGPLRAAAVTVVSALAVFFWWVAVSRRVPVAVTLLLAMVGGRGLTAVLGAASWRDLRTDLGPASLPLRRLPALVLLGGAVLPILELQSLLIARLLGPEAPHPYFVPPAGLSPGDPLTWIAAALVAPACTELLFRGCVQPMLVRRWGARAGVAAAAALSGVAHAALAGFGSAAAVPTFLTGTLVGLLLGWVRQATGSTPAAVVAHVAMGGLWVATLPVPSVPVTVAAAIAAIAGGAWMARGSGREPSTA